MERQRALSNAKLYLSFAIKLSGLFGAVTLFGCDLLSRPPVPTSADYCNVKLTTPAPDDLVLNVWASAPRQHCLRLYAPLIASRTVPGISLSATEKNVNSGPYSALIRKAIEEQSAPDLAFFYNGPALQTLADEGYIYPLSKCGLPDKDWTSKTYSEREWGHPFELNVYVLYFSKRILRELGWDSASISRFPEDINNGKITLTDLLTIARHAVDTGEVEKGFAFTVHDGRFYSAVHLIRSFTDSSSSSSQSSESTRDVLVKSFQLYESLRDHELMHRAISQPGYSNLSNRTAIRDAVASGRVLFSHSDAAEWKRMLLDHVSSESVLADNVGIALLPAVEGGGSAILNRMGSHVIFSEKATGKTNQLASCKVLRSLANSDLHREHAKNTGQIAHETGGIWVPTNLPSFNLDVLHRAYQNHPDFLKLVKHIRSMIALLADKKISADQAASLTAELIEASVQ